MTWHGRRVTVYASARPTDRRKGFDGLCALVTQGRQHNPLSGDVYLFVSRDRVRAEVLHWDGTGLCVFAKRLERGGFVAVWRDDTEVPVTLTVSALQLLLDGSTLVGRVALAPPALTQFSLASDRVRSSNARHMIDLTQERDLETLRQVSLLLDRQNQRLIAKTLALTTALARLRGVSDPEQLALAELRALEPTRDQTFERPGTTSTPLRGRRSPAMGRVLSRRCRSARSGTNCRPTVARARRVAAR